MDVAKASLLGQCPQIKVIRLEFNPQHHTKENYQFVGTMQKSNGWKIQDGVIKTAYENKRVFDLTSRDLFSTLGVKYKGGCKDEPILSLAPMYTNMTEKHFAKPPVMSDYLIFAKGVSISYQKECPETEFIKFHIDPMPKDFECASREKCYITTSKNNEWKADRSQFDIKEPERDLIPDILAMANILDRKEYALLHNYKNLFAFFYESFIQAYSNHCRPYIKDPVVRKVYTIETQVDGLGSVQNQQVVGEPREVVIERQYGRSFDQIYGSWKPWAMNRYVSTFSTYQKRGRSPSYAAGRAMGFFTRNYSQLENFVQGSCMDEKVQSVYRNMYEYAHIERSLQTR